MTLWDLPMLEACAGSSCQLGWCKMEAIGSWGFSPSSPPTSWDTSSACNTTTAGVSREGGRGWVEWGKGLKTGLKINMYA